MTTRAEQIRSQRGYFGIGVYHAKTEHNIGTLWRSAMCFGADFIFTVGRRYKSQPGDTTKTARHVPLFAFDDLADLRKHLPEACPLVGVELDDRAESLPEFRHPERACYLLGAEDHGLPPPVIDACHSVVVVPGATRCLNVSVAGSIVMFDRLQRRGMRS